MTAVLWDMDDTLLNTLPGRMKALAYAHEACLGWKTDPEALWRSHRAAVSRTWAAACCRMTTCAS